MSQQRPSTTANVRSDNRPQPLASGLTEISFDGVKTFLHIVSEFMDPEPADLPAEGDQRTVTQTVGELSVAVRIRVPAAPVDLDIQPPPSGVESKIEVAAGDRILRNRIEPAPAHRFEEPTLPFAVERLPRLWRLVRSARPVAPEVRFRSV